MGYMEETIVSDVEILIPMRGVGIGCTLPSRTLGTTEACHFLAVGSGYKVGLKYVHIDMLLVGDKRLYCGWAANPGPEPSSKSRTLNPKPGQH